jgi:ATP-binding cassette subfamily F protein 3
VIFQNGRIDIFEGRYQEFLDRIGWQEEGRTEAAKSNDAVAPEQKFSKKEMRKLRSDIISERSRVLAPLEKKIAAAEAAIEACEAELARASAAMQSASESGEALRIVELSKVISRCDADIDRLFDELSHDTAKADDLKKLFDERLARLEIADL